MDISEALKSLKSDKPILVRDKTVEPHNIDEFKLPTGEMVYWIKDGEDMWMAIDEVAEEAILFNEVEADVDATEESVIYAGDDYEFTSEVTAKILDEDEEEGDQGTVHIKDFERSDGQVLRVMETEVTGEVLTLIGWKISDDEMRKP